MDSFSHKAVAKMYLSISLRWSALASADEGQVIEYEEVSNKGKTSAENLRVQR
jgi:hypothetical protein